MKVALVPVSLEIGGTEVNALELAAATRRRGHEVVVISRDGPLRDFAEAAGLRVRVTDFPRSGRPRPKSVSLLRRILREERPDIVHAYEERYGVEAFFAVGISDGVPLVMTEYCMRAQSMSPRAIPVVAGTPEVADAHRVAWPPDDVFLIEPPVDTEANSPDAEVGVAQRRAWGVEPGASLVVIVSRLDLYFKIDCLIDTIDAIAHVARRGHPVRLVIVGDGEAMSALSQRAEAINQTAGRELISLVGAMVDPIPAYRAADVVVGMGTSILRAMAVGKPCVLVGERGYSRPLRPDTVQPLLRQGFWGMGDGSRADHEVADMIEEILGLSDSERRELGDWARAFVTERFGLESTADKLVQIYGEVVSRTPDRRLILREAVRVPLAVAADLITNRIPGRLRRARVLRTGAAGVQYGSAQFSSRAPTNHLGG